MESAFPLFARLLNETGHSLDFSVEEGRCPIPSLGPGRRRLVNLSKISKICSRRKSSSWWIKVSIDKKLTAMTLEPGNFLDHAQILFKFEENENRKFLFIAEGIKDGDIGMTLRLSWNIGFVLGMNDICNGRTYSPIADVLLEFPMNMQQTRFQQIEAKGSLKKRVPNICSDVSVVPEVIVNSSKRSPLSDVAVVSEAIVNSNKRSPPRKEESPQTEVDNSVKHTKVNPPKRANGKVGEAPKSQQRESNDSLKKSDVAVVSEAIVNSNKRSPPRKEESPQTEVDNSVKHTKVNPSKRANGKVGEAPKSQQRESNDSLKKRKTTATYTPLLNGSRHDTFETEVSNSSQMEPLHREGNSPDFCCHHHYHSFDVPNKDITEIMFMLSFAILGTGLFYMLLLGF